MKHKNVIILHADQQRYDSLGCMGNPSARTPNIDALAAEGTLFTRHVAANPVCMPSRASLMTGLYPPGHNVWANGVALKRDDFGAYHGSDPTRPEHVPDPPTLGDMFSNGGYDTVSFGKLHFTPYGAPLSLGYPETLKAWEKRTFYRWHGPYYGFDHVELTKGHGERPCFLGHYALWLRKQHPRLVRELKRRKRELPIPELPSLYPSPLPLELHHTTWLARQLCDYVERRRGRPEPFFAFVGFPDPHHPFTPCHDVVPEFEGIDVPEPHDPTGAAVKGSPPWKIFGANTDITQLSEEARRIIVRYTYAMVHQIDLAVGRVVETLKAENLWDDTVLVFTSDHGDFLGDHGRLLKGQIGSNSLLQVPFVLSAPGRDLPPRVTIPMSNADVLPTLAGLAGVEPPEWIHGRDIVELVRSSGTQEAMAFCARGTPDSVNYTVYDDTCRMTWYPHLDFVELYDHGEDLGECRNLAGDAAHRGRVRHLTSILTERIPRLHNPILGRTANF